MSSLVKRCPIYYGWLNVVFASVAMTVTLPGRTHGLGLITKPLLEDLGISETDYAKLNFFSSLLGALFAFPIGYAIDRFGVRVTGTVVALLLALSVEWMSVVTDAYWLFLWLTLVRGFGQTALSIVSMAMIGKWFQRRAGMAMGVFAVLLTFGFIASILAMGGAIEQYGWRTAWQFLGWTILASVFLLWMFVRDNPESCGIDADFEKLRPSSQNLLNESRDYRWDEAMWSPSFWIAAVGTSVFNLVWSAITLFNESILAELQFSQANAVEMMAILTGVGLLSNILIGKLATRDRSNKLLGLGLAVLAIALTLFPSITTLVQLRIYSAAMGFVGGLVTVVFFAIWGQQFGRTALGKIQGTAQSITVLASALGPLIIAQVGSRFGSYAPGFRGLAIAVAVFAAAAWFVPVPSEKPVRRIGATGFVSD